MQYRFVTTAPDYSDLASGRVIHSRPGVPALPVRLISEIFQRCLVHYRVQGGSERLLLYDPCCGGAYHLTVLGLLHGQEIRQIVASDVDGEILETARRNLALLTPGGLNERRVQLADLYANFAKPVHTAALSSLERLAPQVDCRGKIPSTLFQVDATDPNALANHLDPATIPLVITDIPYGQHSHWQEETAVTAPAIPSLLRMLDTLHPFLAPNAVVAVISDKGQHARHPAYAQLERLRAGKRQIIILQPILF